MVVGIDTFAAHFNDYRDRYVLIGGAATWLVLDEAGITPRATMDLDIVLCLEALDRQFGAAFWEFIEAGGYEIREKSSGGKTFYRFQRPSKSGYPIMLELFSRKPDLLILEGESHLTPIPIGEDISSLSAILLEEGYYDFLHQHKREIESVPIVTETGLIPLKARAWLDLKRRKEAGGKVDSRNIRKHKTDVLRLYLVLPPDLRISLPQTIREDMLIFLNKIESELTTQLLKGLGIRGVSGADVVQTIKTVLQITE